MALNLIRGRKTPSRMLDTMLVKRDSFGHVTEHMDLTEWDTGHVKALYNKVFYRLQGARGVEYKAYQKVMRDCIDLISAEEYRPELHDELEKHFREALDTGITHYADMELLQELMDEVYELISSGEERRKDRAEVRRVYRDIFSMMVSYQQENTVKIIEANQAIDLSLTLVARNMMQFEHGYDQDYAVPLSSLPYLGIRNAYLYMLETPVVHLDGEQMETPEYLYLKAALKDGEITSIKAPHQKISIYDLYCNDHIGDDRYSMAALPIYSNDELYGYILVDVNDQILDNSEMLVNQLSAAYRMLHILARAQDIMDQLEASNEALKRNNIILDSLSKIDQMTGVYNRRGFWEAAEACIQNGSDDGVPLMVMYVDMDNLKIVNDRYGHDEGDFALQLIADTLSEIIDADHGVIGRLGGDEFACTVWTDSEPEEYKNAIREKFDEFNGSSDKPYYVTASVGIYKVPDGDKISLEEALAFADEDLYKEKQNRSRKTAKD